MCSIWYCCGLQGFNRIADAEMDYVIHKPKPKRFKTFVPGFDGFHGFHEFLFKEKSVLFRAICEIRVHANRHDNP